MSTSAGPVLRVDADPAELGLDPARLERLDRHFRRYVDDGRLPGWLIAVVRHGQVVHLQTSARATSRPTSRSRLDTLWRIYSMTKPITVRRGDDALGGGRVRAQGPGRTLHPVLRRHAGVTRRLGAQAGHRAAGRADAHLAPAHAHRRAHVRLPPRAPRRPRCTARPGSSGARPPGWTSRASATRGPGCRCCSSPAASGTTPWPPTCSDASSRSPRASRSTRSSPSASSSRSGCTTPPSRGATATSSASPRSTRPTRGPARRRASTCSGRRRSRRPRSSPAAAAWSRPRTTTTASRRCCSAAASWTASRLLGPRTVAYMAPQPPARRRRPRGVRPPAVRRDDVRRHRLRPRVQRRRWTRRRQGAEPVGRVRMGRRREHRVLGRPGRGHHARSSSPSCCRRAPTRIRPQLRQLVAQALVD